MQGLNMGMDSRKRGREDDFEARLLQAPGACHLATCPTCAHNVSPISTQTPSQGIQCWDNAAQHPVFLQQAPANWHQGQVAVPMQPYQHRPPLKKQTVGYDPSNQQAGLQPAMYNIVATSSRLLYPKDQIASVREIHAHPALADIQRLEAVNGCCTPDSAHSSADSSSKRIHSDNQPRSIRLAIPQSWVGNLLSKSSVSKCRLQQIREDAKLQGCTLQLMDGTDRKKRMQYRCVEVTSPSENHSQASAIAKIILEVAKSAGAQRDGKVYMVIRKGEAGAIIGKGGQDIRRKREEFKNQVEIKVIEAKMELSDNVALQAGVVDSDEAIRLDGEHKAVLELLYDFSLKILRFQEGTSSHRSSASPVHIGPGAMPSLPKNETVLSSRLLNVSEALKKEECSIITTIRITQKQKNKLMENRGHLMAQLRKQNAPIYLKLIDDSNRGDGMREVEIGGVDSQNHIVDCLRDKIKGL